MLFESIKFLKKTSLLNLRCFHLYCPTMDRNFILKPPESVRDITKLDRKLFEKHIKIPVLNVITRTSENENFNGRIKVSDVLPIVKKYLLKLEHLKPIINTENESFKVYLNPEIINTWLDFPEDVRRSFETLSLNEENLRNEDFTLKYEHYSADTILKAVLPKDKEGMSSFTKVGHIVHVNLREHLLPFKDVVGEVLFDKVPNCKSVVNKVNMIDNTYRNFSMEVLKGSDDMLTSLKENNCQFKFDFSTVYWNSRLCTEHERIVKKLQPNDILFDVFAGVGPFSIPSARKKCTVYANDLNPESFNWLNHNKKLNKIDDTYLKTYNLDGKDFILSVFKENLQQILKNNSERQVYVAMNLPALAVEFLPNFVSLFNDTELPDTFRTPILFVYCFAKGENLHEIAKNLVITSFQKQNCVHNIDVSQKITEIFSVRTVSSMKDMMRVTVRLDRDVLIGIRAVRGKEELKGVEIDVENKKRTLSGGGEEEDIESVGCSKKGRVDGENGKEQEESQ